MFEAFRCTKPLAAAAAPSAPAAVVSQPAASPRSARKRGRGDGDAAAVQVPTPARRQRRGAAAAAAGQQQEEPGEGGGLALEKMGDAPLRLVIVGHNPSAHAWASGHFYSNPSNWMWHILRETGIAPPCISGAADDGKMPAVAGVGLTDVGSGTPGTDSSQFSSQHFAAWRPAFYARLAAQAARASGAVPGCACGACGAPAVVAFSGKRQFTELFAQQGGGKKGRKKGGGAAGAEAAAASGGSDSGESSGSRAAGATLGERLPILQAQKPASVATGRQWVLPEGWPLPLSTEVWVMSSTSGAAPMTREQRLAPWQALAERLQQEPWPRQCAARCCAAAG